jgi:hypothetical protein
MATNAIYVETEEEIPEVVERIRRSGTEDTMLVLPMRSRIGQSRFNFQLLRNYSARMGKRVTVVCDDPAVQKMASESGFAVFGAIGPEGEGIPSEGEVLPPIRKWWERRQIAPPTHVGVAAPRKLLTKTATELKPGRFLLYVTAATLLAVGIFAVAVFVPSASITLIADAKQYSQKDVEIKAQPGKPGIRVRADVIAKSNSQGFKTTGLIQVPLAHAIGQVVYTNNCQAPRPGQWGYGTAGLVVKYGQRLRNSNGIEFAQTTSDVTVGWGVPANPVNIIAVQPGSAGNVGSNTIQGAEAIVGNPYACLQVANNQATGGGTDPSSTPQMTESDFDAGRAQLEQQLHQVIAQELQTHAQPGEKLSEWIIFSAPQYTTDHQPNDKVPTFTGTMTVSAEGDFYFDADVQKAYQTFLTQQLPNDQQLLTESPIQTQYRLLNASKGGNLTFAGSAFAYIAPKLDESKIRSQIVGRPLTQARFYLTKLPIKSVSIKEDPIALPIMPLLINRISLHYIVQSGTPSASAAGTSTPVPSPSPPKSP